jgi:hypothetical protein
VHDILLSRNLICLSEKILRLRIILINMFITSVTLVLVFGSFFFSNPYSEISLHKPSLSSSICHRILTFRLFSGVGAIRVIPSEVALSISSFHSLVYKNYPHHLSPPPSDCNYQAPTAAHSPNLPTHSPPLMTYWPFHHPPFFSSLLVCLPP